MAGLLQIAHYIKNNRGQTIVEFALIIPFLLLLVVGVMEFGLILNQYMVVAEAAREGARSAALGGDDATATSVAKAAVPSPSLDRTKVLVTITPSTRTRGSAVTVTVTYPLKTITNLMSSFFTVTVVTGVATMRME